MESQERSATARAFARAGLLGNPSDAYGGMAVAFTVSNFSARVTVSPGDHLGDPLQIDDPRAAPLLNAALTRFRDWTGTAVSPLRIRLQTDVPFQVGLAGSSAIIVATLRALAAARRHRLDPFDQAELALAAEVEELGLAAGPMDRAIQAYEGLLHMDFAGPRSPSSYTSLDPGLLPPLLIAWDPRGGQPSHAVHSDVRERWQRGDPEVRDAMARFREIVTTGTRALRSGDHQQLCDAVDANFDTRAQLFPIADRDREMIELARSCGAAAKQCGSGGACLAVLGSGVDPDTLAATFEGAGYQSCRPVIESTEAPTQ